MHISGTVDSHVHFGPHAKVKANTDAITMGRKALEREMAGLGLKCNYFSSAGTAYMVHQLYPQLHVCGGIVINPMCGGFNPAAVRAAIGYGEGKPAQYCRFVCLPTFSSKRDAEFHRRTEQPILLVENGRVSDELKAILNMVAEYSLVLMTGHVGADELFPVIEQAVKQGVKKIVVPHPLSPVIGLSAQTQKELAGLGAVMQQCCVETYPYYEKKYGIPGPTFDQLADTIRYIGVEHCIIASDMGGDAGINPTPTDGFANFIDELEARGFTETELKRMAASHPMELFFQPMPE